MIRYAIQERVKLILLCLGGSRVDVGGQLTNVKRSVRVFIKEAEPRTPFTTAQELASRPASKLELISGFNPK